MAREPGLWAQLSALDAFPKVNEDFFKKTMSGGAHLHRAMQHAAKPPSLLSPQKGNLQVLDVHVPPARAAGVITLLSSCIMLLLFMSELREWQHCAMLRGAFCCVNAPALPPASLVPIHCVPSDQHFLSRPHHTQADSWHHKRHTSWLWTPHEELTSTSM